jgi:hypothetical protein
MLSHIPQPPQGMHMNTTAQAIFTIGQVVPCLVFAFIAGRMWRRERSPIAALFMVGGALAMFMEPIVDVLGQVWFPRNGQWRLFETWGRPIPWFIVVYIWYVGGQAFIAYRQLEKGGRGHDIWKLYGIFFLANVICETPGLYMNLYAYYGHQPLNFFRLPLWWPAVNAAMPILAGTLVFLLRPYLQGWRVLAVILLIPAADGMANAAVAWPTWNALNTRLPAAVVWAAGCLTVALATLMIHFIALVADARNAGRAAPPTAAAAKTNGRKGQVPAAV